MIGKIIGSGDAHLAVADIQRKIDNITCKRHVDPLKKVCRYM